MAKIPSAKHVQIDKAMTTTVGFVGTAVFLVIFSIVASKSLLSQRAYQARVIKEKTAALKQLRSNNEEAKKLVESYGRFVAEPTNIIGGSPSGTGDRDGDNAKIILDALPSKYDFPALATSIEKIIGPGYKIDSITGNDDEVKQGTQSVAEPVDMPFELSVTSNLQAIQDLIARLQNSIRPIAVTTISLKGGNADLKLEMTAKSYYQPGRTADITTKEVR